MTRRAALAAAVLVAALAAALHGRALGHAPVYDDQAVLERQMPRLPLPGGILFPPAGLPDFSYTYYRPAVLASYALDRVIERSLGLPPAAAGRPAPVPHAVNLLLHGLAAAALFAFARAAARLSLDAPRADHAALAAALVFAVHPVHVEAIAWMAGRADLLCGAAGLGALALWLDRRPGRTAAALVLFALALAAKETALALLALLPLLDLAARRDGPPPWRRWAAAAAVTAGWALLRLAALAGKAAPAAPHDPAPWWTPLAALGWYVRKLLWPAPQSAFAAALPGPAYIAAGLAALLGAAWLARRRHAVPGEALGAALLLATLAPPLAVTLVRVARTPLAERYLYLPSAGACLLLGLGLARLARHRTALLGAATAALVLPAGVASAARTEAWRDPVRLWRETIAAAPREGEPHLELGRALRAAGRDDDALAEYEAARVLYRDPRERGWALNNMGSLLLDRGRLDEARAKLDEALREHPGLASAWYNLGVVAMRQASADVARRAEYAGESERALRRALELEPGHPGARLQLGMLLCRTARRAEGEALLRALAAEWPAAREGRAAAEWLTGGAATR